MSEFWLTFWENLLFWNRRNGAKRGKPKSKGHVKFRNYK